MTTVECWYKPEPNEEKKIERDLNLPFDSGYQSVRTGTIIKNASEIKFGETAVFYVFRVVVGRSFVMKSEDVKRDISEKVDLKEKLNGTKY